MTWQDRLKESIQFLSPEKNEFEAKWSGDSRKIEKSLGLFKFPEIQGTLVQDLDVGGTRYPINFFFAGEDNDLEAKNFLEACKERGKWEILHPIDGLLTMQLMSVEQRSDPIGSGNITRFVTEWIEPIPDGTERSLPQIEGEIDANSILANISAASQFVANVFDATSSQVRAVTSTVGAVVNSVKKNIRKIERFQLVPPEINAIIRGIESTIDNLPLDLDALTGQIQGLLQVPAFVQEKVSEGFDYFFTVAADLEALTPEGTSPESRNIAAVQELSLTALNVAVAQTSITGSIASRSEAVELTKTISDFFISLTDTLDITQKNFLNKTIDLQFFSQSESFFDSILISARATEFLFTSAFDLATEKRFTLEKARSPIEIVVTEYETLGENDSNLDLFIESNQLTGNDIRLLPTGREVLVYIQ